MKKVILCLLLTSGLFAGEFDNAMQAYKNGNFIQALNGFYILAKNGDAKAQYNVGVMFMQGQGVKADIKKAMMWYEKAAKQGIAKAQYNLAEIYQGLGSKEDHAYEKARYWYEKAAEQGIVEAYNNLGTLYWQGKGIAKDPQKAFEQFKRAAEKDDKNAQMNVALLYLYGKGTPIDKLKAYENFKKALKNGKPEAKAYLDTLCKENSWVCQQ